MVLLSHCTLLRTFNWSGLYVGLILVASVVILTSLMCECISSVTLGVSKKVVAMIGCLCVLVVVMVELVIVVVVHVVVIVLLFAGGVARVFVVVWLCVVVLIGV